MNGLSRQSAPPLVHCVLDLIGQTPMLELHRIANEMHLHGRLLAKCEMNNPGLSKKDRIAHWMIQEARRQGQLAPGQTVIEMTSGNTGTGLALVCAALGHPFIAVMSRGNTPERAAHMAALGAEVVLVDQSPDSLEGQVTGEDLKRVDAEANRLTLERNAYRPNQFSNPANILAHQMTTGPEIWQQSGGQIDVFVDCLGTAGTFTGIARYLKSQNPKIRCYVIEPENAAVLNRTGAGDMAHSSPNATQTGAHKIQGAGYSRSGADLPLFDPSLVDGYLTVSDADAMQAARFLAQFEGLLGGFSTGAHLAAAIDILQTTEAGKSIVFLVCDSGLKYLSTDLF